MDSENLSLNNVSCKENNASNQHENYALMSYAGSGSCTKSFSSDHSNLFKNLQYLNENYLTQDNLNTNFNVNSYNDLSLQNALREEVTEAHNSYYSEISLSEQFNGNVFNDLPTSRSTGNVSPSKSLEEISSILQNVFNDYSIENNTFQYQNYPVGPDFSSLPDRKLYSETTESFKEIYPINQEENFQSLDDITEILHDFINNTNCSTNEQNTFVDTFTVSDISAKPPTFDFKISSNILSCFQDKNINSFEDCSNLRLNHDYQRSKFSNKRMRFDSNYCSLNSESACDSSKPFQTNIPQVFNLTDKYQPQNPNCSENSLHYESLDDITRTLQEFFSENVQSAKSASPYTYLKQNISKMPISNLDTTSDVEFNKNTEIYSHTKQTGSVQKTNRDPLLKESFNNKNIRTKFTTSQTTQLQTAFSENHYLNANKVGELILLTDLPKRTIKIWFQNQRKRYKNQNPKRHCNRYPDNDKYFDNNDRLRQ